MQGTLAMKSTAVKNTRLVVALLAAGSIGGAGVGAFQSVALLILRGSSKIFVPVTLG